MTSNKINMILSLSREVAHLQNYKNLEDSEEEEEDGSRNQATKGGQIEKDDVHKIYFHMLQMFILFVCTFIVFPAILFEN